MIALACILALAFPALLVALIERQLNRHSAHDRLDQCADEHDRAVALTEFTLFHSVTINSREG